MAPEVKKSGASSCAEFSAPLQSRSCLSSFASTLLPSLFFLRRFTLSLMMTKADEAANGAKERTLRLGSGSHLWRVEGTTVTRALEARSTEICGAN
eukprot:CAMPEP_0177535558 /NCGR_PEP_ID=MMETSP0369-20130122/56636_1 /TAXON_ID=447022 ORGANISM="Scrippsiella hangoei-like, Strain SHHI-4" /NCGR_SAMPLE_ID=MMETSP0369 /ASSEMBLY_ACC=CAM_ASM_000364 /LENGTH=95 /DNA_ID=CAMNT_0019017767 /DNA_START=55 /DNA_END=342 /DNA_ORIENTATION=+